MAAVGMQPRYDRTNGWYETLGPQPEPNVLRGATEADHVVIGAGYAGLAVARRLGELQPGSSIVLIDAGRIGNNAAGRCSGFIIDHAHNIRAKSFADDTADAKRQIALNRAGLEWLEQLVHDNAIDCDWRKVGKTHAAATDKWRPALKEFAHSLDAVGEDYEMWDAAELKRRFGTSFYIEGLHAPHTAVAQPAALVIGLARTLPRNVTVYENSAITSTEWGSPHVVATAGGSITTPSVILAANGFGAGFGFFTKHLLPVMTWGSMTRELTADEADALGGEPTYDIISAHAAGTTVRRLPNNRILIRNPFSYSRRNDMQKGSARFRRMHEVSFRNRYPMLPKVDFEYTWGGALSLTRNGSGVCGPIGTNIWASMCCQGTGMAKLSISGKMLAEWIATCEKNSEIELLTKNTSPSRNYPEPFNGWGVNLNTRWRSWQAGIEE